MSGDFWGYPGARVARLWRRLIDDRHRCRCACKTRRSGMCGPCLWCRR